MYKKSEWHSLSGEKNWQIEVTGDTYVAEAKTGTNPDPGTNPPPPPGSGIVRTRVRTGNLRTRATCVRYCRAAKQTVLHRRRAIKQRKPNSARAIRKFK